MELVSVSCNLAALIEPIWSSLQNLIHLRCWSWARVTSPRFLYHPQG